MELSANANMVGRAQGIRARFFLSIADPIQYPAFSREGNEMLDESSPVGRADADIHVRCGALIAAERHIMS